MHSLSAIGGEMRSESAAVRRALEIGMLCQFAARLAKHGQMPLGAFVKMATSIQQVGQLKLYFNNYDKCLGYVMWALLTPDVERDLLAGRPRVLADWEYNDGSSPWILDMAVLPGALPYVLEDLRDVVFKDHEQLTYFRLKGAKRIFKRLSRQDRSSFIKAGRHSASIQSR
ncbi:toxin-activating lysine-acyltransferase [Roseateles sp. DC23W]|uniref:RTX toxin-activating lysine-acyltransferase n=1 Tax=Pelomonas dachongensis TaxID=3299029 RepID=A0ABW7EXI0_9BURK